MNDTQSSVQKINFMGAPKRNKGNEAILKYTKSFSIPSNALLFPSLHMVHISAKGETSLAMHLLLRLLQA